MNGDAASALEMVTNWEDESESAFDAEAPTDVRDIVTQATQQRLAG